MPGIKVPEGLIFIPSGTFIVNIKSLALTKSVYSTSILSIYARADNAKSGQYGLIETAWWQSGIEPQKEDSHMIPFQELHQENHDIAELSKVLKVLIQDREVCDTRITDELFERYIAKVNDQIDYEDKNLYSMLLASADKKHNALANRFLEGGRELRRIFDKYQRRWCARGLHISNHETFINDTLDVFNLIEDRIIALTEELYPAVRSREASEQTKSA